MLETVLVALSPCIRAGAIRENFHGGLSSRHENEQFLNTLYQDVLVKKNIEIGKITKLLWIIKISNRYLSNKKSLTNILEMEMKFKTKSFQM